jgi:hypothetical protein
MSLWPQRPLLALLTLAMPGFGGPAMAQDTGGVALAPGSKGGPVGLARPLPVTRPPLLTAREAQNGLTPADHQAADQNAITNLRGDPGFLAGFSQGTPLAPSRQTLPFDPEFQRHHPRGPSPIIINNQGPLAVTVGNGNVVQQQSANGSGPIAQQQVATTPAGGSSGGGATNLVTGGGNIVQRAPGTH